MRLTRTLWALPADPGAGTAGAALDRLGVGGTRVDHAFTPYGTSAAAVDHALTVAVHTWPEHGLATLDHYGPLPDGALDRLVGAGWRPLSPERPC